MKLYGNKKIKDSFLNPDDENIDHLIKNIQLFWSKIRTKVSKSSPRTKIHEGNFDFKKEAYDYELSEYGLNENELSETIAHAMGGCIRWNEPKALYNITPTPLFTAVASTVVVNLLNPNAFWDYTSGRTLVYEKKIICHLASLAGWNKKQCDGIFVSGGKITNIYGIKVGIGNCMPESGKYGVNNNMVILVSESCHYSLESSCDWLGLGKNAVVRIPVNDKGQMNIPDFESIAKKKLNEGKKIACIILSGGNTTQNPMDSIKEIVGIRKKLINEFCLDYKPHIHVDSVIGWLWLYFSKKENTKKSIDKSIIDCAESIRQIKYADSFGADFHKTGLCPYISSAFIIKKQNHLRAIADNKNSKKTGGPYGTNYVQYHMLEHSRSAAPILAVWSTINYLGKKGMQDYIIHLTSMAQTFKNEIQKHGFFLLNDYSYGFTTIIMPHINVLNINKEKVSLATTEQINSYNAFCHGFYRSISFSKQDGFNSSPLIGLITNYKKTEKGLDYSAFRIHPNSPFLNSKICKEICNELGNLKKEYEQREWFNEKNKFEFQPK
ncbi:MAG: hypothetical protein KAI55_04020 [Candidatus Aenigmarchaeota archaeon]|nr:hypothetical protein [Candidatus Aenigmarchaeota archaeon]